MKARHGVVLPVALALLLGLAVTVAALAWGTRVRVSVDRGAERADAQFAAAESVLVAAPCPVAPAGTTWSAPVEGGADRLVVRRVHGAGSCWLTVVADGLAIVGVVKFVAGAGVTVEATGAGLALTPSDPGTDNSSGGVEGSPSRRSWAPGPSWVDLR